MNGFVSSRNIPHSGTQSNDNIEPNDSNHSYYNQQNEYRIEEGIEIIEETVPGCCCVSTLWRKDCNIYRVWLFYINSIEPIYSLV